MTTPIETALASRLRTLARTAPITSRSLDDLPDPAGVGLRQPPPRRRGIVVAVVALAAAAVTALVVSGTQSGEHVASAPPAPTDGAPTVAYLSDGALHLSTGTRLPDSQPSNLKWSADGQFLAFDTGVGAANELHIVRADGTDDRVVWRGRTFATAWSGDGDVLAASLAPGGLLVVRADGAATIRVPTNRLVFSFAWSSSSMTIAYVLPGNRVHPDEVRLVDAVSGADSHLTYGPGPDTGVLIGKWWPDDRGLVWWVDPAHSAALEDRGLVLESVAFADLRPRPLATTVVYLPWLAWSPDGTTLALVAGTGGSPTHDKRLELCRVAPPSCSVIAIPAGAVALDPAWSADGTRLAFVTALDWTAPASGQAWFATRRVWAASSDGSGAEPVTGAPPGVTAPTWLSPDVIGYVTGAGIQAVNVDSGSVVTFADRLSGASGAGPDSYGKTPWGGLAVWRP